MRLTLLPRIVGRRIAEARLLRRDVLVAPGDPSGGFARQRRGRSRPPAQLAPADLLEACEVVDVLRRGKQLAIAARDIHRSMHFLVVQLGMSGQVLLGSQTARAAAHVHAVWRFDNHDEMRFRDPRRFGGLRVFRSRDDLDTHWRQLGPDAIEVTPDELFGACRRSARSIKALLLDQAEIAGVGNIYADEALFQARIRPSRRAGTLKADQVRDLAAAIRAVLRAAVRARGSSLRDFRDANDQPGDYQSDHLVYGRRGQPCTRCRRPLRSTLLAQRTTVWCSVCQH